MRAQDIPKDVISVIRAKFDSDPKIVSLNAEAVEHQRMGRFMQAMLIRQKIETLFSKVLAAYTELQHKESMTMAELPFSPTQRMRINGLLLCLYMATDILDTCIRDINDAVKAADSDCSFEDFAEVKQLATLVKGKLQQFENAVDYADNSAYYDAVDKQYNMLYKKALAMIKQHNAGHWKHDVEKISK